MPIIFPHEMAAYLVQQGQWPDSKAEQMRSFEFWQHFKDHDAEWAEEHPYEAECPRPVGLYGDDAVYNVAGDKMYFVTWNDVLASTDDRKLHSYTIFCFRQACAESLSWKSANMLASKTDSW